MLHRQSTWLPLAACLLLLGPADATASPTPSPSVAASVAPVPGAVVTDLLHSNTVVELELIDAVSSDTSKPGDFFKMRVAVPIVAGEHTLVPVGAIAVGQVVHAQKARFGGKGGELILAPRYLELPQGQVKLRSTFGAAGASRVNTAMALTLVFAPLGLVVKGKSLLLPSGSALSARVSADTLISSLP